MRYWFYSKVSNGDVGFFKAQSIVSRTESQAWLDLKEKLTAHQFKTAEIDRFQSS